MLNYKLSHAILPIDPIHSMSTYLTLPNYLHTYLQSIYPTIPSYLFWFNHAMNKV